MGKKCYTTKYKESKELQKSLEISNSMDERFCIEAAKKAIKKC